MKFLLDTTVVYWMLSDRPRQTLRVLSILEEDAGELYVSLASIRGMAIKIAKRKLIVPQGHAKSIPSELRRLEIRILPISEAHVVRTQSLPHRQIQSLRSPDSGAGS